jgi:hypothetical protein
VCSLFCTCPLPNHGLGVITVPLQHTFPVYGMDFSVDGEHVRSLDGSNNVLVHAVPLTLPSGRIVPKIEAVEPAVPVVHWATQCAVMAQVVDVQRQSADVRIVDGCEVTSASQSHDGAWSQ